MPLLNLFRGCVYSVLLMVPALSVAQGLLIQQPSYLVSPGYSANQLAGNTVLIVRHAEKPADGDGLTPAGEARARAYSTYFANLVVDGVPVKPTALFAGSDDPDSMRPRLTLEPLARSSGLHLNATISTKAPDELLHVLQVEPHGRVPLICWRHKQMGRLLTTLGADPAKLLPDGKWPDDNFDTLIVLKFDAQGKLVSQQAIKEPTF